MHGDCFLAKSKTPKLFWFHNQVSMLSYHFDKDTAQRLIKDDAPIIEQDFNYLVAYCPKVLIYQRGLQIIAEAYHFA